MTLSTTRLILQTYSPRAAGCYSSFAGAPPSEIGGYPATYWSDESDDRFVSAPSQFPSVLWD
jgi:hypothetical protein